MPFSLFRRGSNLQLLIKIYGNGFERICVVSGPQGRKYYKVGFKDRVVYANSVKLSQVDKGLNYAFMRTLQPLSLVGTVYLVHEFVDTIQNPRRRGSTMLAQDVSEGRPISLMIM